MGSLQFDGSNAESLLSVSAANSIRTRHSKILALTRVFDSLVIYGCLYLVLVSTGNSWTFQYLATVLATMMLFGLCAELSQIYYHMRGLTTKQLVQFILWCWACTSCFVGLGLIATDTLKLVELSVLGIWSGLTPLVLVLLHLSRRGILGVLRTRKQSALNVAIIGATPLGVRLYNTLTNMPWLGCKLVGFYDDRANMSDLTRRVSMNDEAMCGNYQSLMQDVSTGKVDTVYVTLPMAAEKRIKHLVDKLADTTVTAYLIPDVFSFDLLHSRLTNIRGIPALSIYDSPIEEHGMSKRIFDIILSIIFIAVTAIPMLFIALAVKLTSPGPVLFKQTRYGIGGKEVKVWKFRSMTVCEDGNKVTQATKNDMRVTKVGAFIRRTSLDELPQFFNTLGGSMSIVGPRPHAVAHNEYYRRHIKGYMLRHKVKPGITGLAQINGFRGETAEMNDMEGRVRCDLEYIRSWSLLLDLKIVFLTVFKGFVSKQAY